MMFGYTYLIGDPAVRERVNETVRIVVKSIIGGFACIGLGVVLRMVAQILAW